MELSICQYKQKSLYITPWFQYRKEQDYYLAYGEKIEAYLPFMDVVGHLKDTQNKPLWHLLIQDSVKDILTMVVIEDFYTETDLKHSLDNLHKMLSVFPSHPMTNALLNLTVKEQENLLTRAATTVATWHRLKCKETSLQKAVTVTTLKPVKTCLNHYPSFIRSSLQSLHSILHSCADFLEGVYLHGSLATLDFIPGASDLDLVYFLNSKTVQDPQSLLSFRRRLQGTATYFYQIDSLQHHGPYILSPVFQNNYLESYLPIAVWRNSRPLLGSQRISFKPAESPFHQELWFRRSVQYYRRHFFENSQLKNLYDAKLFLSMSTLLPAIAYSYAKGEYTDKVHALAWIGASYPHPHIAEWIEKLTCIRTKNLYQPHFTSSLLPEAPDHMTPMNPRLTTELTDRPYLPSVALCDCVLGIEADAKTTHRFNKMVNFPVTIDLNRYDHVAEKLKERLVSIDGVTRVLVAGTCNRPGISDLDLLIVTRDQLTSRSTEQLNAILDILNEEERAIVMHPPMALVPESLVKNLDRIFPVSITDALWGEIPQFNPLSTQEQKILTLVQLNDFAVAMNGRLFVEMMRRHIMDVRLLLNVLGGLKYSVRLIQQAGARDVPFLKFLQDIERLRAQWMKKEPIDDLPIFLNRGLKFVRKLNQQISDLWRKHPLSPPDPFTFRTPSTGVDFIGNDKTVGYHIEDEEIIMHLPCVFSIPLLHYALMPGPLSNHIRQNLTVAGQNQEGVLGEVLSRRAELLNKHYYYLVENQLRRGFFAPFHFGWQLWKTD